jgi:GTP-binding protein
MFRDECEIEVVAGKGGDGLIAFRREAFVARGGPWGGNGGDGGDVILVADSSQSSLLHAGRQPRYAAGNGQPGGPANRTGHRGQDFVLPVPVGTQVRDRERGHLLRDLSREGDRLVLAKGGAGGRGNAHFANAVRQTPRIAEPGRAGESRHVRLELKIVAEIGLIGLPNAGKSTFLARVSAATPKIADYPFTTLEPQVGIAHVGDYDTLCIADLPGLIEGASDGVGLGIKFLKHVERCPVLVHLVDVSESAQEAPIDAWRAIRAELEAYSDELASRPALLVASKCESESAEAAAAELEAAAGQPVVRLSSSTGRGVAELLAEARRIVRPGVPS